MTPAPGKRIACSLTNEQFIAMYRAITPDPHSPRWEHLDETARDRFRDTFWRVFRAAWESAPDISKEVLEVGQTRERTQGVQEGLPSVSILPPNT